MILDPFETGPQIDFLHINNLNYSSLSVCPLRLCLHLPAQDGDELGMT